MIHSTCRNWSLQICDWFSSILTCYLTLYKPILKQNWSSWYVKWICFRAKKQNAVIPPIIVFIVFIRQWIKYTPPLMMEGIEKALSVLMWWIFIQRCQETWLHTMSCSLNMLYSSLSEKKSKDAPRKMLFLQQQRQSLIQKQNTIYIFLFLTRVSSFSIQYESITYTMWY